MWDIQKGTVTQTSDRYIDDRGGVTDILMAEEEGKKVGERG
jgi:hypothetical protein